MCTQLPNCVCDAEDPRPRAEIILGIDKGSDDWTVEIIGEVQPDGTLLIVSEHRYKTTIDG